MRDPITSSCGRLTPFSKTIYQEDFSLFGQKQNTKHYNKVFKNLLCQGENLKSNKLKACKNVSFITQKCLRDIYYYKYPCFSPLLSTLNQTPRRTFVMFYLQAILFLSWHFYNNFKGGACNLVWNYLSFLAQKL